jgi:hypothetical protein
MAERSGAHACDVSYMESTNRMIALHTSPGIRQDPISKVTNAKRVVEWFK